MQLPGAHPSFRTVTQLFIGEQKGNGREPGSNNGNIKINPCSLRRLVRSKSIAHLRTRRHYLLQSPITAMQISKTCTVLYKCFPQTPSPLYPVERCPWSPHHIIPPLFMSRASTRSYTIQCSAGTGSPTSSPQSAAYRLEECTSVLHPV